VSYTIGGGTSAVSIVITPAETQGPKIFTPISPRADRLLGKGLFAPRAEF
jgi:hypothetical protein